MGGQELAIVNDSISTKVCTYTSNFNNPFMCDAPPFVSLRVLPVVMLHRFELERIDKFPTDARSLKHREFRNILLECVTEISS